MLVQIYHLTFRLLFWHAPWQIIVLEDTKEYISYAPKNEIEAQERWPFDLLVICRSMMLPYLCSFLFLFIYLHFTYISSVSFSESGHNQSKAYEAREQNRIIF